MQNLASYYKEKPHCTYYTYKMADDNLEIVSHHPYLGIELTQNLKWSLHINNIVQRQIKHCGSSEEIYGDVQLQ